MGKLGYVIIKAIEHHQDHENIAKLENSSKLGEGYSLWKM